MNGHATEAPLRVALIGGGLGGLSFANAMLRSKKQNLQLTVYEGARKFSEIGAGIGMGQNAFDVMCYLGLEKAYEAIGEPCNKCQWRYGEADRPQENSENKLGETPLLHSTVHRAELLDIMVKPLPAEICKFGKRLNSYSQEGDSGPITLSFADGTQEECDILVGADGVKSVVREQLFKGVEGVHVAPVYTGTTAARGIIDMNLMKSIVGEEEATRPQMYLGTNQHILIFPIQQGKTVNIVAFHSDRSTPNPVWDGGDAVFPITSEKLLSEWSHWSEKCQNILKAIEKPQQWALHELRDLPYHAKGSVCLIGDSAHATLPHQGAGAGAAIESGVILCAILNHPTTTRETIGQALEAFNHFRVERTTKVKTTSNQLGRQMEFVDPDFGDDKEKIVADLNKRYDHIWQWKAEPEVKKVTDYLDEKYGKEA